MKNFRLDRRAALRGAGTLIALPLLDAMLNDRCQTFKTATAAEAAPPTRLFVWSFGNGTRMNLWQPQGSEGSLTSDGLSQALSPLGAQGGTDLTSSLTVVTGLDHKQTVLSGAHDGVFIASGGPNVKSNLSGYPLPGGPSIDQVAGDAIGAATRLRALPISNDKDELINWCILSWSKTGSPIQPYRSPKLVFEKLFGGAMPDAGKQRQALYDKSVLDFVLADATRLSSRLGSADRAKVEEHLEAVRQVEKQSSDASVACVATATPEEAGEDFVKRGRIFADLLVLAMKCDITRFGTFHLQNSDGNQVWPGMSWQDHTASHDAGDDIVLEITRRKMAEFRYLIEKMASTIEGDRTLLDHSLVLCTSEIGQGNAHSTDNLPVVIAGRGGGMASGRLLKRPRANYNDMLCSLLNYTGVPQQAFGIEGKGPLAGL